MNVISILFNFLNPFSMFKTYIKTPLVRVITAVFRQYKEKADEGINSIKDIFLRGAIIALATAIIVWISVFMYVIFYYTYMPSLSHVRPVHLQFKSCGETETINSNNGKSICSFPSAHVSLTKKQQLMMVGQPYKVYLILEMPESHVNKHLGMFMVCAEMRDAAAVLRSHSCRSTMLHYRSQLLQIISTFAYSPLLVLGTNEEKQVLNVELFASYKEDQSYPVTDVYVEVQSTQVEIYSSTLYITAHFSGLRYIMFHWPILSAAIGISTNLFFIALVCILSWYHWSDPAWLEDAGSKCITKIHHSKFSKSSLEGEIDESSLDESIIEDISLKTLHVDSSNEE